MLRPSAFLTFTLDGPDATAEVASAVKRSYSYVAPTKIVAGAASTEAGAAGGGPATSGRNSLALEVVLRGHTFWLDDEASTATWEETLMPWLGFRLEKLFGTVREFNNETRRSFTRKLGFATFDLRLGGRLVTFDLEPDSSLRDAAGPLNAIRDYLNANGAGGSGTDDPAAVDSGAGDAVARFTVPSDAERGDADWFDAVFPDGRTRRVEVPQKTR